MWEYKQKGNLEITYSEGVRDNCRGQALPDRRMYYAGKMVTLNDFYTFETTLGISKNKNLKIMTYSQDNLLYEVKYIIDKSTINTFYAIYDFDANERVVFKRKRERIK